MPSIELKDIFSKASSLDEGFSKFHPPEKWERARVLAGARRFKGEVLGLWRSNCTKSSEEMAELFYKLKMVSSVEEGKQIVPHFANERVDYTAFGNYLRFTLLKDSQGQECYRIEKGKDD